MTDLPRLALSVRQPWAWAIIHAGKDIENRSEHAARYMTAGGTIALHAAKGMTQWEYTSARDFMTSIDIACPPPAELQRGGIIGTVEVVDVVRESASPWFSGPRGLVLRAPNPIPFIPSVGALGLFAWEPADRDTSPKPARWMMPATTIGNAR